MTLTELRLRIKSSIGRDGDDTINDAITYALEKVQDEVISKINFNELISLDVSTLLLVANTQTYNLPSDFWKMIVAWDYQDYDNELQRITPNEYKTYLPDVDSYYGSNPIYYDLMDNVLSTTYRRRIKFFPYPLTILNGAVTTFTDYSGTVAGTVEITDASHGLTTGDSITISGTTNYDGVYTITKVDDNNFYITATYVAEAGGVTKTWIKNYYIPFVYMKKLSYISGVSDENVLTGLYPQLFIEGASYYLYRDVIYRDDPVKIAFRRSEYQKQIESIKEVQRSPDIISKVLPKRLLPAVTGRLYTIQTSGYTS